MRRRWQKIGGDQRGVVLPVTLMLMGLLGALAGAYALAVRADMKLTGGAGRTRSGFYAAEAGLNVGMAEFANIFRNYGVPTEEDFAQREIAVGNRTVYYQLDDVDGYAPCTEEQPDCFRTIPAGERFAGLKTIPYRYTVTSTSVNPEEDEEVQLGAEFDIHNIPIFQFLAFYANDLEILPGPNMNLSGRIHTNGRLYLSAGNTLTIGDRLSPPPPNPFVQVSATQGIYRGRKNDSSCTGTVIVDKLEDTVAPFGDYDPLPLPCNGGSAQVPQTTLDAYKGSMVGNANFINVPTFDTIARGSGTFWQKADLRIVLNLDTPRQTVFCGSPLPTSGGVNGLFTIEVQNEDGSRDAARTNTLWQFMCERRGAIFYNDVPVAPATVNTTFPLQRTNYTPNFGGTNNDRVYRRVGEDTNGDGVINTSDRNDDICPVGSGAAPWWRPPSCPWPNPSPLSTSWFIDNDYRRGGFRNNREQRWVLMLNVNIRALLEWNQVNGSPLFAANDTTDWGLVIFLSVQGPLATTPPSTAGVRYGVRVFDSADLDTRDVTFPTGQRDPTGLTVVSDQAIYIQGNYNYYPSQTNAQKYPAAVIGDTVNVLSQGWEVPMGGLKNDLKSAAALSSNNRNVPANDGYTGPNSGCGSGGCASFTTATALGINAAFISGVDNTVGSSYNGGLENYPRFHERWTSRTLNYRGSFVSLGVPLRANGAWCGTGNTCNIYDPPTRVWDYDADFNQVEKLPPLTPMITYVQQRLYTRFYK